MVEAALVTPIFMLLIMGILEYGLVFRDYLTVSAATTAGARAAAVSGNAVDADWLIIQGVADEISAIPNANIQKLVVYKAAGPDSPVPTTCKNFSGSGTVLGVCNVYTPSRDWTAPKTNYNCTSPGWARGYCPTTRRVAVNGPPDYIGIYIQVRHDYVSQLFGSSATIESTVVTQAEPQLVAS